MSRLLRKCDAGCSQTPQTTFFAILAFLLCLLLLQETSDPSIMLHRQVHCVSLALQKHSSVRWIVGWIWIWLLADETFPSMDTPCLLVHEICQIWINQLPMYLAKEPCVSFSRFLLRSAQREMSDSDCEDGFSGFVFLRAPLCLWRLGWHTTWSRPT